MRRHSRIARFSSPLRVARWLLTGGWLLTGSWALGGCTTNKNAAAPLVRVRAEKDLRCPSDQIQLDRQIGGKYTATGCGRRAVYNSACDGLECAVSNEDGEAPGWRDRPDPGSLERDR